jgi:hypothetical protein
MFPGQFGAAPDLDRDLIPLAETIHGIVSRIELGKHRRGGELFLLLRGAKSYHGLG